MLPALGNKDAFGSPIHQDHALLTENMADLGHLNTGYPLRDALAARNSEEQFVVVTAVQGGLKVDFAARFSDVGEGYGIGLEFLLPHRSPRKCGRDRWRGRR